MPQMKEAAKIVLKLYVMRLIILMDNVQALNGLCIAVLA